MADTKSKAQIEIEAKLGNAIKSFGSLVDELEKVQESVGAIPKKMGLVGRSVAKVKAQFAKLGDRFPVLLKSVKTINSALKITARVLRAPITAAKALGSAISKVGEQVQSVNAAVQLINTSFGFLRSAAASALGFIAAGVENIAAVNPFDPMIIQLNFLQQKLMALRSTAVRPLAQAFTNVSLQLVPMIDKLNEFFGANTKTIGKALEGVFVNIGNAIVGLILPGLRLVAEFLDRSGKFINNWQIGKINKKISETAREITKLKEKFDGFNRTAGFNLRKPTQESIQNIKDLTEKLVKLQEEKENLSKTPLNAKSFGLDEDSINAARDALDKFRASGGFKVTDEKDNAGLVKVRSLMQDVGRAIKTGTRGIEEWSRSWFRSVGIADEEFSGLLEKLKEMPRNLEGPEGMELFKGWLSGLGIAESKFNEVMALVESAPDRLKSITPIDIANTLFSFTDMQAEFDNFDRALESASLMAGRFSADVDGSVVSLGDIREALNPVISLFPEVETGWNEMLQAFKNQPNLTMDQQVKSVQAFIDRIDDLKAVTATNLGAAASDFAKLKEWFDKFDKELEASTGRQKAALRDRMQAWANFGSSMGSVLSSGFQALVTAWGTAASSAEEAEIRVVRAQQQMTLGIIQSVEAAVMALAVKAAVNYATSVGGVAGIGAAIAIPAALGLVFGIMKGFINSHFENKISDLQSSIPNPKENGGGAGVPDVVGVSGSDRQRFSTGGFVRGGIKGVDSVPIMAMPGEYVMSIPEVQGMERFLSRFGTQGKGIQPAPVGNVQNTTNDITNNNEFIIEFNSQQLPNKTETKKWVRDTIVPALRQLQPGGY